MTIQEEYKILLKRKTELEIEIDEIKRELKENERDFEKIKFIGIDFDRGIKCRNDVIKENKNVKRK